MRRFASLTGLTLVTLAACGGQSPKACTDCAMVAGDYQISFGAGSASCGLESLISSSGAGTGYLAQSGSSLSLTFGSFFLTGTLHTDNSALFGPASDTAVSLDGTSPAEPGEDYLAGFFTPTSAGGFQFDGTLLFIQGNNGCEVDSSSTWR